jgi:hypothetical protein
VIVDGARRLAAGQLDFPRWQTDVLAVLERSGADLTALVAAGAAAGLLAATVRTARTLQPERALAALERGFTARVVGLTRAYAQGRLTLPQWRAAFAAELDAYHPAAAIVGAGGSRDEAVLALGRQRAAEQRAFLDAWAAQLEQGGLPSERMLTARARLYAGAGKASFYEGQSVSNKLPRMPFYPGDGGTECLGGCVCAWKFQKLEGDGNWDCYWNISPAEHCPTCLERQAAARPLKVRGGVIVTPIPVHLLRR